MADTAELVVQCKKSTSRRRAEEQTVTLHELERLDPSADTGTDYLAKRRAIPDEGASRTKAKITVLRNEVEVEDCMAG